MFSGNVFIFRCFSGMFLLIVFIFACFSENVFTCFSGDVIFKCLFLMFSGVFMFLMFVFVFNVFLKMFLHVFPEMLYLNVCFCF